MTQSNGYLHYSSRKDFSAHFVASARISRTCTTKQPSDLATFILKTLGFAGFIEYVSNSNANGALEKKLNLDTRA